jgi:hypothetical protein
VKRKLQIQLKLFLLVTIALFSVAPPVAAHDPDHRQLIGACTKINHDYALARDKADEEAYANLFTGDAKFVMQGETFTGTEQIVARLGDPDTRNFARLLITTVDVSPIDATTATGVTYFIMYMAIDDPDPTPPITKFMVFMGEYHDEYKLTEDGCKFSRRETKPLFTGVTDQ